VDSNKRKEALRFVYKAPQTRPFVEMLEELEREAVDMLASAEDEKWVFRAQGRLAAVRQIIDRLREVAEE